MKRFIVSTDLSQILDKQQTQLMVTTAVSTIGLAAVFVANLVTISEDQIVETIEQAQEAVASKED